MNRALKFAFGGLLGFLILLVAGGAYWVTTPTYGLARVYTALALQNEGAFRKRVDVESVARGLAKDFVDAQTGRLGLSGEQGDFISKVLTPMKDSLESKLAETIHEFVDDYFQKDSHGYRAVIQGLPLVALQSLWEKRQDFHLISLPSTKVDGEVADVQMDIVWWGQARRLVLSLQKRKHGWTLARVQTNELQ